MPAAALPTPATPPARVARHVARHLVRTTRARLRRRREQGTVGPITSGGVHLAPATGEHAPAWFRLVADHDGPPAQGLGASPLGGAARTTRQWRQRLRRLRAAGVAVFVVTAGGDTVAGEALVYVDGGTAAAELVVWLSPGSTVANDVIAALTGHVLTGDVRRVFLTTPAGSDIARAAEAAGYAREGVLVDPPFADRVVYVRHISAEHRNDG